MNKTFMPSSEQEAATLVKDLKAPVALRGGGTRIGLGRRVETENMLSTAKLSGITLYESSEMIMSVRAGTPIALIEETLAAKRQMLPFEPMDHRALYGTDGEPSFGAIAACNISGPRRLQTGAARDSIVGLRFVNGRGEVVQAGGRVMKNVTGLDLVKLSCGAYGSLGLLTEITFKLLPCPERSSTLVFEGLDERRGIALLTEATGLPYEVSAAAHLPARADAPARTALRVEGMSRSVGARLDALDKQLGAGVASSILDGEDSARLWRDIRDGIPVAEPRQTVLWRISLKPTDGPLFVEALSDLDIAAHYYDWAGGLIWLALTPSDDTGEATVRSALSAFGGHASLVRAPDSLRRTATVFQPLPDALMRVTSGIKRACDPRHILNPGVMYPGI